MYLECVSDETRFEGKKREGRADEILGLERLALCPRAALEISSGEVFSIVAVYVQLAGWLSGMMTWMLLRRKSWLLFDCKSYDCYIHDCITSLNLNEVTACMSCVMR